MLHLIIIGNAPSNPYCCDCSLEWYWILVICIGGVIVVIAVVCLIVNCCCCCPRDRTIIIQNKEPVYPG